jgi:NifU-like protein involved in Fe-S cluster formation
VIGRGLDELQATRDALQTMLKSGGPAPQAPFDEMEVLRPAQDFKNRHASILLSIEAVTEAMLKAEKEKDYA